MYQYRSLFEKDKLLFAFLLATRVLRHANKLPPTEYEALSFKNPPAAIKLVMEAVCVMLDAKPTMVADPNTPGKRNADYWDTGKRLLLDTYFINRLKEFDRDNIQ
ncbi:uncharacterized protein HaLaN_30206, partial [Haematococcus lacustris]